MMKQGLLPDLLTEVRACRLCRDTPAHGKPGLPHEPRPVLQLSEQSQVLIAGQAPGARVHASGRPFTDPSGVRLRSWLDMDESTFYDPDKLAIVPMGFCFPGNDAKGGDLPPRQECRHQWHDQLFASRQPFALTLVIGRYARDYHMPDHKRQNLTETLHSFACDAERAAASAVLPLPHPSWRNTAWLKKHPWFEQDLLPIIRRRVHAALNKI